MHVNVRDGLSKDRRGGGTGQRVSQSHLLVAKIGANDTRRIGAQNLVGW